LWALTEEEQEGFQDGEAEDLIRFAEGLDFNKYIDDLEFRQCLTVVRDRAKKLQHEQDAFKAMLVRDIAGGAALDGEEDSESEEADDGFFPQVPDAPGRTGPRFMKERGGEGRLAVVAERPDWDSSTTCGEDPWVPAKNSTAALLLEANPQMRAIHSKASVQRIVEKAKDQWD